MMITPSLRRIIPFLGAALLAACTLQSARAQQFKVTGDEPALDSLLSPQLSSSTSKKFRPKEWLEVETRLMVQMAPEPKSKTCDTLTVKWYVAVANPEQRGTFLLFTREVNHVNIPTGEEIYVSSYMSPASIRRILGTDRNPEKAVEVVSYEVLINGEPKAYGTSKATFKHGWWDKGGDKLVRSEVVRLLDKSETPFSIFWWDRYAEVESDKR